MPRYFFHVRSPSGLEPDPEGLEFDCLEDAVADARVARAEILVDEAVDGHRQHRRESVFEITDQTGQIVARVPFIDE